MSLQRARPAQSAGSGRGPAAGFTMVELLIALTIAAVMMGFALPAFNGFINQRTMTANVNNFVLAVNYARSEAARLGTDVSLQAVNAGDGGNEWGPGFCVVQGNPGNCGAPVLRRFDAVEDGTFNAIGGLNGEPTLTFNSRGLLVNGMAGQFQLCGLDNDDDPGRVVSLNVIGRASTEQLDCF